jgi:hypothetical protein
MIYCLMNRYSEKKVLMRNKLPMKRFITTATLITCISLGTRKILGVRDLRLLIVFIEVITMQVALEMLSLSRVKKIKS